MKSPKATIIREANAVIVAGGDLDAIGTFFTEDYKLQAGGVVAAGHEVIRKVLRLQRKAFPVVRVDVEILVADGARVAWMRTLTGVQEGAYKGFAATHRKIVWRDMVTSAFRGGRIAREWVLTDLAEQLLRARR